MRAKFWRLGLPCKNWILHKFDCTSNTIPHGITAMDSYYEHRIHGCIRGHHIYKDIWQSVVGETLECMWEARNTKDRYANAIVKSTASVTGFSTSVVGHLPKDVTFVIVILTTRWSNFLWSHRSTKTLMGPTTGRLRGTLHSYLQKYRCEGTGQN